MVDASNASMDWLANTPVNRGMEAGMDKINSALNSPLPSLPQQQNPLQMISTVLQQLINHPQMGQQIRQMITQHMQPHGGVQPQLQPHSAWDMKGLDTFVPVNFPQNVTNPQQLQQMNTAQIASQIPQWQQNVHDGGQYVAPQNVSMRQAQEGYRKFFGSYAPVSVYNKGKKIPTRGLKTRSMQYPEVPYNPQTYNPAALLTGAPTMTGQRPSDQGDYVTIRPNSRQ